MRQTTGQRLRAGRGAICWIHMSLKSCFYCLSITLTFERKQSLGRRRGAKRKWSSLRKNGNDSVAPQDTARWEGSQGKWSEAVYKTAHLIWSTGCLLCEAIRGLPCLAPLELQVSYLQETSLDFHLAESERARSTSTQDCVCSPLLGCHGKCCR